MVKVLLVEDEPLVRRGIRSMLPFEQFGMELVGEASSGEEALEELKKQRIDLVFTDISMPGMNGLELIQILNERYTHIRSVVLTCHQDFDYLQQALRLGAIDYIVKTQLDDDSVIDLLRRVSAQTKARSEQNQADSQPATYGHIEALNQRWTKLIWLVDNKEFEDLVLLSETTLQFQDWKSFLVRDFYGWLNKCPSLAPIGSMELSLSAKDSFHGFREWLDEFRMEAQRLLRNTLYSEEVIYSIVRSLDLLNEHTDEKLNQTDICKTINMSISYFSKCFRKIVGISFVAYTQERNIRHAQHLLQTTNFPIYRVAEQSGFHDEKYFGKIFRQKLGYSPSEYRQQYRGNPS
ncbi:Transcriptional regulatory protein DegU [compost metagenome]